MTARTLDLTTMRRVDASVGRPVCRLLTWARRMGLVPEGAEGPPTKILVIKLAEQGATVAAAPALRRAVELVGRDNVYVAVFEQNRFVLDELGIVPSANVLTVRTTSGWQVVRDLRTVARRARRAGVDATVDLEFFARSSAILAVLTRAPRRAGLHSFNGEGPDRGDLLTHRVSANPLQHVSHTFLALVAALGEPTDRLPALDAGPWPLADPPQITVEPSERDSVAALARSVLSRSDGAELGPIVLLNPNAGDLVPLRRWSPDRYVELGRRLLAERPGLSILITGAPDEADQAGQVADAIGSDRCASIAGQTSLRDLLVLYGLAEVLVTNDSGPAHYATLTSIDVVALFGPETPAVFGPVGERAHTIWAGIACSPCVNAFNNRVSPCRDNVCMQRIEVDAVLDEVRTVLDRRLG